MQSRSQLVSLFFSHQGTGRRQTLQMRLVHNAHSNVLITTEGWCWTWKYMHMRENDCFWEQCNFRKMHFYSIFIHNNVWVGYFLEGKKQRQDLERCSKLKLSKTKHLNQTTYSYPYKWLVRLPSIARVFSLCLLNQLFYLLVTQKKRVHNFTALY